MNDAAPYSSFGSLGIQSKIEKIEQPDEENQNKPAKKNVYEEHQY